MIVAAILQVLVAFALLIGGLGLFGEALEGLHNRRLGWAYTLRGTVMAVAMVWAALYLAANTFPPSAPGAL